MASPKIKGLLQAVWLKAFEEGEVLLTFDTKNDALKARFQLYNVRKSAIASTAQEGFELRMACEECEISMINEVSFVIRHATTGKVIQQIMDQTGLTLETAAMLEPGADEAMAMLERLAQTQKEATEQAAERKELTPEQQAHEDRIKAYRGY